MLARHYRFPNLCVTLALILFTTPQLTVAAHSADGPRPLYAANQFVPIGKLFSLGAVMIDGRALSGEQLLWGSEPVYAKEASASVQLGSVGDVLLYQGSLARLSLDVPPDRAFVAEPMLTVMVAAGEVAVSLKPAASARVVVGEAIYVASKGAKFKVRTADDERPIEVKVGTITIETPPQDPIFSLAWVQPYPLTNAPIPAPANKSVKHDKSVNLYALVRHRKKGSRPTPHLAFASYSSPQAGDVVADLEVEFCLRSDPTIGVFLPGRTACQKVFTNQDGIAEVEFKAGSKRGHSTLEATVVTSPVDSLAGEITVVKPPFFRWRNSLILAAAVDDRNGKERVAA
jgi:hypothetical protein